MPSLAAPPADGQKKHLIASEQDPEQRSAWRSAIAGVPADRLVFVDESGATIMLTPPYGRAPRGQRCLGRVPRNWGLRTTLVAAMSVDGMTASFLIDGATDRQVVETDVERVLVPTLRPGQVVVWDNLSAHTSVRARAAIAAVGCEIVFLPAYSPDCNPIEQAFSKLKRGLRRAVVWSRSPPEMPVAGSTTAVITRLANDSAVRSSVPIS